MVYDDAYFMSIALEQAKEAARQGEVPVGACIVQDNQVIATGYNRRELDQNALAHAEILAIEQACKVLGGWRLHRCSLYVTLEPCPMCTGEIINARIQRIVYGAKDPKAGCCGSVCNMTAMPFNHHPRITSGVLEEEGMAQLKEFFKALRR